MKKIAIISVSALLLVVCVTGFVIWKINDIKEKKEMAILTDIANIQEQVNALYKDDNKTNLAEHINNETIKRAHDLFVSYNNKEIKLSSQAITLLNQATHDLDDADKMFSLKHGIDSIFDINGAIIESADIEPFKVQLDELKSDKPSFADELMIKINDAEAQKEQISTATKLVDSLFTTSEKSNVKESVTQAEIDDAKANITNIKQDKAKTSLLSYVQVADVYLDEKIKAEAKAKAEAEAKAKAEAEARAAASNKSNSSGKSDGTRDLTGWVPYDTGDPANLIKYLASGDVVKYNGQYWASPDLVDMLSNQEVVYFRDISSEE